MADINHLTTLVGNTELDEVKGITKRLANSSIQDAPDCLDKDWAEYCDMNGITQDPGFTRDEKYYLVRGMDPADFIEKKDDSETKGSHMSQRFSFGRYCGFESLSPVAERHLPPFTFSRSFDECPTVQFPNLTVHQDDAGPFSVSAATGGDGNGYVSQETFSLSSSTDQNTNIPHFEEDTSLQPLHCNVNNRLHGAVTSGLYPILGLTNVAMADNVPHTVHGMQLFGEGKINGDFSLASSVFKTIKSPFLIEQPDLSATPIHYKRPATNNLATPFTFHLASLTLASNTSSPQPLQYWKSARERYAHFFCASGFSLMNESLPTDEDDIIELSKMMADHILQQIKQDPYHGTAFAYQPPCSPRTHPNYPCWMGEHESNAAIVKAYRVKTRRKAIPGQRNAPTVVLGDSPVLVEDGPIVLGDDEGSDVAEDNY